MDEDSSEIEVKTKLSWRKGGVRLAHTWPVLIVIVKNMYYIFYVCLEIYETVDGYVSK